MLQYFIRRVLLAIPTFIGCTIVVFFIVQLAPGGPLEQQVQALKAAASSEGGGGNNNLETVIPKSAMAELERYYQFDKPIWARYLIWLGLMSRPMETADVPVELEVPRNAGEGKRIVARRTGDVYTVHDAASNAVLTEWNVEYQKLGDGTQQLRAFKTEHSGILTGNFGKSHRYQEPVMDLMISRMPISLQFGLIGIILGYCISIYLGVRKALHHGSTFDVASSGIVFILYSIPGWAVGAVLLMLFATSTGLDLLPLRGFESSDYADMQFGSKILDRAMHFILPTLAYTIGSFATLTMLMKNSLLEALGQDYVRTAFAKGIRESRVIWLHAMRNSIIPIASRLGGLISIFFASSYLVEIVFGIEGMGKLSFNAIGNRDYTVVFAFTVFNVVFVLLGSILSDFILALVDPRIKFK